MGRLPALCKCGTVRFSFGCFFSCLFSYVYFLKFWWKQLEHKSCFPDPDTWDVSKEESLGRGFCYGSKLNFCCKPHGILGGSGHAESLLVYSVFKKEKEKN